MASAPAKLTSTGLDRSSTGTPNERAASAARCAAAWSLAPARTVRPQLAHGPQLVHVTRVDSGSSATAASNRAPRQPSLEPDPGRAPGRPARTMLMPVVAGTPARSASPIDPRWKSLTIVIARSGAGVV